VRSGNKSPSMRKVRCHRRETSDEPDSQSLRQTLESPNWASNLKACCCHRRQEEAQRRESTNSASSQLWSSKSSIPRARNLEIPGLLLAVSEARQALERQPTAGGKPERQKVRSARRGECVRE